MTQRIKEVSSKRKHALPVTVCSYLMLFFLRYFAQNNYIATVVIGIKTLLFIIFLSLQNWIFRKLANRYELKKTCVTNINV